VEDRDAYNNDVRGPSGHEPSPSATAVLLTRARTGDIDAREELFQRFVPILRRWAHCRLPAGARDLNETMDLVQMTLLRALNRLDHFDAHREGAFLAYLRQILLNVVRNEVRRSSRRGLQSTLDETLISPHASVMERMIGVDQLERYQRGLDCLAPEQREVVLLRLEFGYTYQQIAEAVGKPSADAARMTVVRALAVLAEIIDGR